MGSIDLTPPGNSVPCTWLHLGSIGNTTVTHFTVTSIKISFFFSDPSNRLGKIISSEGNPLRIRGILYGQLVANYRECSNVYGSLRLYQM